MEYTKVLDWVINYGLGTTLSLLISFGAWKLITYILSENTKREDRLASIIENHLSQLTNGINKLSEALVIRDLNFVELKEANKQQREEHREIVAQLTNLAKIIQNIETRIELYESKK